MMDLDIGDRVSMIDEGFEGVVRGVKEDRPRILVLWDGVSFEVWVNSARLRRVA